MRPRTFLLIPLLALLPAFAADKKAVFPEGANPAGPFSPAIIAGGTIYVSGQVGRDAAGKTPEVFEDEVKQTLDNIGVILKKAGYDFSDAVAVQVFCTAGCGY